jgi:MFS family permease
MIGAPPLPTTATAEVPSRPHDRYRCGTLVYTQAGLFVLFSWILWGDFCFTLMEQIWPNVLPLMLKSHGASNFSIGLIMVTLPSVMNFVLNPIISTASDRFRGRRGRRIPFLLAATPFITIFLILLGFSRQLSVALHGSLVAFFPDLSPAMTAVGLIGFLVAAFRFFELFVNTVFWYLFNDVVPVAFMGRFLGFFRIAGALAGAFFNFTLLKYAESHTSEIFLGVALLYGTMFFLMCLNVKEGEYPPPDPMAPGSRNPLRYIGTFFRECFSHRIYRLVFTYNTFYYTGASISVFMMFAAFSIGLNLEDVGKVTGTAALVGILLMYPMGVLVDRFHPIRVMIGAQVGACLAYSVKLIFLFHDFPPPVSFWIFASAAAVALPMMAANSAAGLPMLMRIFPQARFGQFCAANAMCGAVGTMAGGALASWLLDWLKSLPTNTGDFYYRWVPAWSMLFSASAALATWLVYREWQRLGGAKFYSPPGETPNPQPLCDPK